MYCKRSFTRSSSLSYDDDSDDGYAGGGDEENGLFVVCEGGMGDDCGVVIDHIQGQ